jgi:hypothetical protein
MAIALRRWQRLLVVVWTVCRTCKRRSAFLADRSTLRGDGGGRHGKRDLGRRKQWEFLEKERNVRAESFERRKR